jgi:hypothetical protein
MAYNPYSYERQCEYYAAYGTSMQMPQYHYEKPKPFTMDPPDTYRQPLNSERDWDTRFTHDFKRALHSNKRAPNSDDIKRVTENYASEAVEQTTTRLLKGQHLRDVVADARLKGAHPLLRAKHFFPGQKTIEQDKLSETSDYYLPKYGLENDKDTRFRDSVQSPPQRYPSRWPWAAKAANTADKTASGINYANDVVDKVIPAGHTTVSALSSTVHTIGVAKGIVGIPLNSKLTGDSVKSNTKDQLMHLNREAKPRKASRFREIANNLTKKDG